MPIAFGMPPPVKTLSSSIRLLCIKAGHEHTMVCLGPLVGLQTHWTPSGTKPCEGHDCQFHEEPTTWKGYMAVLVDGWYQDRKVKGVYPWVLVATEEIGTSLESLSRGQVMKVARRGVRKNGALSLELSSRRWEGELPPSFDVKPYVLRACGRTHAAAFTLRAAAGTRGR